MRTKGEQDGTRLRLDTRETDRLRLYFLRTLTSFRRHCVPGICKLNPVKPIPDGIKQIFCPRRRSLSTCVSDEHDSAVFLYQHRSDNLWQHTKNLNKYQCVYIYIYNFILKNNNRLKKIYQSEESSDLLVSKAYITLKRLIDDSSSIIYWTKKKIFTLEVLNWSIIVKNWRVRTRLIIFILVIHIIFLKR